MKIRTVIVEDEAPSLRRLRELLKQHDDIEIVGEAADGPGAVTAIDTVKPDLVFLDIQLPVYSGFKVLEQVTHRPNIIFITAYDQYAIRAFEENAVDYLMKPTDPARLAQAIDRVRHGHAPINAEIISVLRSAVHNHAFLERFSIRTGDEVLFIPTGDVYWFHAEDKYVFLHTANRKYIYDSTLKDLEQQLDPAHFIRIHKSIIVAIDKIHKLSRSFRGKYKVHLTDPDKSSFEIGRSYAASARNRLHY